MSRRVRGGRLIGWTMLAAFAVAATPPGARAQPRAEARRARVQPELRADFITARADAAHLGAGVAVATGTYVRLAVIGAAGSAWTDGRSRLAGRVDGLVRFVADPLRESRWAPYAAGGVGGLYDDTERWRAVLIGALGIEGPASGGMTPAVEVGFGGGMRIGIALRRAFPGRR